MLKMKNETPEQHDVTVVNADGEWVEVLYGDSVEIADDAVDARAAQGFTATPQAIGAAIKRAERAREEAAKEAEQEADAEEADADADQSAEGESA